MFHTYNVHFFLSCPSAHSLTNMMTTGEVTGTMVAATDNLAWQGPKESWTGAALRPVRFEDNATYSISGASTPAMQSLLTAASGGLVLEFWIYVNRFLTYGRDNMPLVALMGPGDRELFGLQGSKWSGQQLVAARLGNVANETHLKPALTLARWHFVRLAVLQNAVGAVAGDNSSASSTSAGVCSAYVDGQLVAQRSDCQASKLFSFCSTPGRGLKLVVGTFDG